MRMIHIFRLAFACLLLWPTVGLADEHEGGGHHDTKDCDTTPVKFPFHDTTLYNDGTFCLLINPEQQENLIWVLPVGRSGKADTICVFCTYGGEDSLSMWIMSPYETSISGIPIPYTAPFYYSVQNSNPDCSDREGDTIYVHFAKACDTIPVKLPLHDTVFCEGDSLLLVATNRPHEGYSTLWSNLSTAAEWIHEGDSFYITEPGTYAFRLYNMVNNGCPDIDGDTVMVMLQPKPQAFLPVDTVETCGGRGGALLFESDQLYIDFRWSDGDSAMPYRFAYRGDTLDKRFCTLTNACGDTLVDTVTVRFLPPYAYLGGDSLLGCRGDSALFDMEPYNRHLPDYGSLRFVWTLRGETLPNDPVHPARRWFYFPQDSGLLTVQVFYPDPEAAVEPDGEDAPPAFCPVATDTIKLQFYIWPDIDFFVRNGDTTICFYDSIPMFLDRDSLVFSPDAYYIWLFNEEPYDTTADKTFYAADTGLYTVTGVNYCSRHSESFFLHHHPKARITVELKDTTVCPETPVSLDPTLPYAGNRYVWFKGSADEDDGNYDDGGDDGGSGNYMQFRNPGEAPEDGDPDRWPWDASAALWIDTPAVYTLYVMDSAGCMAHFALTVTEEDCTPQFEATNVFTPNGDGVNDVFKLKTMEKLFDFEIRFFNRWGNQVYAYKGEPEEFSWDGNYHGGQAAPDGVYFYIATFKDYKGKKKKQSGSVTILR